MLGILNTVLPVFLIIGAGYTAARWGGFGPGAIDGVMSFAIRFAASTLLFLGLYRLDLSRAFDARLLVSFYTGALTCFALGALGARFLFGRRPGEAVAIGFCALFSNSLLLGLPIMTRAYGADALEPNYAILSIHAPFCYLVGIVTMEIARSDGAGVLDTARRAARQMFSNALAIGLGLGFFANLSGVALPGPVEDALDMLARAALPAALFALGGALTRYAVKADLGVAIYAAGLSILLHPLIVYSLGGALSLSEGQLRSAVVTASMPTGLNGYVFASMYKRAESAAASTVLLATAVSVLTVTGWLWVLGGAVY